MKNRKTDLIIILLVFCLSVMVNAESQDDQYSGVSDPFGDPTTFEFSEDEKADKEFFHLGRFLMVGLNAGLGVFTGGLGRSISPRMSFGMKFIYFYDKSLALEFSANIATHEDLIRYSASSLVQIETSIIPITLGARYYFDTRKAPRAIGKANPYLAGGLGLYIRRQALITNTSGLPLSSAADTSQYGFFGAVGGEFSIYRKHIYVGFDLRYHMVFFTDEDDTFNNTLPQGERAGDYFLPSLTFTYNF